MELSRNLTDVFEDGFVKDKKKVMAQRAVHKNGIQASCESIEAKQTLRPVFSIDLETGKVIIDKIPAMEMTREMTIAKIGLFIKNLDITFDPPIWTVRHRLKG